MWTSTSETSFRGERHAQLRAFARRVQIRETAAGTRSAGGAAGARHPGRERVRRAAAGHRLHERGTHTHARLADRTGAAAPGEPGPRGKGRRAGAGPGRFGRRTLRTAAPAYRLDALRIGTSAGPAPECVKVPNVSYGFGPLTATLSEQKTAICAVLPTATGDYFTLRFTPAGPVDQTPTPWMYDRSTLKDGCEGHTCTLPNVSPRGSRPSTLVIGLPEKPAQASTAVRVDAKCAVYLCGPDERTVATVGPSTVGRGKVTMTVTGSALREDGVVQLTSGSFQVRSTNTSVTPDRRRMTVVLDLTKAPLGPMSVSVFAHGMQYGKGAVTLVAPIRSTAGPTITGTAVVGGTVTATTGTWSPVADSYAYQWLADGAAIGGATTASYTLPAALQGKQLTLVVTARKAGHPAARATSAAALVKGAAPKATTAPSLTGTAKVGSVLTASRGTWTPAPTSYAYRWYADGKLITGATGTTFTLTSAQLGKRITLRVTAYRTGHVSGTASSLATGVVAG